MLRSCLPLLLVGVTACASQVPSQGADEPNESAEIAESPLDRLHAAIQPTQSIDQGEDEAQHPFHRLLAARDHGVLLRQASGAYRLSPADVPPEVSKDAVAVLLPAISEEGISLQDPSGVRARIRTRGVAKQSASVEGSALVYRDAIAPDAHLVYHATPEGAEDYVIYETPGAATEVTYDVALEANVAGVRFFANTLELLDSAGTPRLRMAPPTLFDATGRRLPLGVSLSACEADRSAAPPWGRAVTAPNADHCSVTLRWEDSDAVYPLLLDPTWSSTGRMILSRWSHVLVKLANGRVLAAGGSQSDWTVWPESHAEVYDPTTNTWSATGPMVFPRVHHSATLLADGRVLVVGGETPDSFGDLGLTKKTELYNPTTGTWVAASDTAFSRWEAPIVRLPNNQVLVLAGANNDKRGELFNPTTHAWSFTSGSMALARNSSGRALLTVLNDGRVLVVGGHSNLANQSEIYTPSTQTFGTPRATVAPPSFNELITLSDGRAMLASTQGRVDLYDPVTNTWTATGSNLRPGKPIRLSDDTVLARIGSGSGYWNFDVEIYRPEHGVWSTYFGPFSGLLYGLSPAVALSGNRVLVAGLPYSAGGPNSFIFTPDAATPITSAEYRYPPHGSQGQEVWGRFYRPTNLVAGKQYPLIYFVHGVHGSCKSTTTPPLDNNDSYTYTGTCPAGYTVVKNHEGFAYAAEELARRGYFVVAINALRGIYSETEDSSFETMVQDLTGVHFTHFTKWNNGTEATPAAIGVSLQNRIDLNNLGFVGHSRGALTGAGNIRASLLLEPPNSSEAQRWPGGGTAQVTLLGTCDEELGLEGVEWFDEWLTSSTPLAWSATYVVHGANHRSYNTSWSPPSTTPVPCPDYTPLYTSDTSTVSTGSQLQRQTLVQAVTALMLGNLGSAADPNYNRLFNTSYTDRVPTFPRISRGYSRGTSATDRVVLNMFNGAAGTSASASGAVSYSLTATAPIAAGIPEHPYAGGGRAFQHAALVNWSQASTSTYFQANFTTKNLSGFDVLEFRIDRAPNALNPTTPTALSLALVTSSGVSSLVTPVLFAPNGPVLDGPRRGASSGNPSIEIPLQTVRIPLSSFTNANLASVQAVRVVFNSTPGGSIYLANVQASKL